MNYFRASIGIKFLLVGLEFLDNYPLYAIKYFCWRKKCEKKIIYIYIYIY